MLEGMLTKRALALSVSVAASLAYLLLARWMPVPMPVIVKGLAVMVLGLVALCERSSFLAAALLLSALGDVLLEMGRAYFLLGLAAFLTSHIVYILLFARHRDRANQVTPQMLWPVVLSVYGTAFAVWLAPSLGDMRVPVVCYIAALITMVATASRANYRSRLVFLGALLFLLSDSLLGAGKFKLQLPWSPPAIWITYYLGQCCIALGVLSENEAARGLARRA